MKITSIRNVFRLMVAVAALAFVVSAHAGGIETRTEKVNDWMDTIYFTNTTSKALRLIVYVEDCENAAPCGTVMNVVIGPCSEVVQTVHRGLDSDMPWSYHLRWTAQ